MERRCDVLVVGAGAGGIGAALAAARHGAGVCLLEAAPGIGGTAARGGVCHWEPGAGGTGIPLELYRRLRRDHPGAIAIYGLGRHCAADRPELRAYPGGEHPIVPEGRYADTLRRSGAPAGDGYPYRHARTHWRGVCFRPEAYAAAAAALLEEAGVVLLSGRRPLAARLVDGALRGVTTDRGERIAARVTIDASGGGAVAALADCRLRREREARRDLGEPSAPATRDRARNGATLMFRIAARARRQVDPLPPGLPAGCWWAERFPAISAVELPGSEWSLNMLPTMDGAEADELGPTAARAECSRRIRALWHHLQTTHPEFQAYRLADLAPSLGLRDAPRVVCRRTLTEHDLRAGLAGCAEPDVIAVADHPIDVHGAKAQHGELAAPYGIPFRCLVAAGVDDLLVASRGAGFSALAAASVRLTRTVMQLGQAAGTAAALACALGCRVDRVPPDALRARLAADGVQLGAAPEGEAERRVARAEAD